MTAQRSFHVLMLGLCLCLLSGVVSKVTHKSDNEMLLKPEQSMTSVGFWKEVARDLIEGQ